MKKIFTLFALCAIVGCQRASLQDKLAAEVEHFNTKEAPQVMDEYTTKDSVHYYREQNVMQYFYSVAIVDSLMTDEIAEEMRSVILNQLRGDIQMRKCKEAGVAFRFTYVSRDTHRVFFEAEFSPEDYR